MPATIETTVYQYAELDERAKERAAGWWFSHYDFVEEMDQFDFWEIAGPEPGFLTRLADAGFDIATRTVRLYGGGTREEIQIFWELNPSDVWFDATIDVPVFLRAMKCAGKLRTLYNAAVAGDIDAGVSCDSRGHYGVEVTWNNWYADALTDARMAAQMDILESDIKTFYRDITREMARALSAEYDERTSEEMVADIMDANGYTFTADGERFG